jgi:hypothetical protein
VHSVTQEEGQTGPMPPRTSTDLSHINRSQLVARVPELNSRKHSAENTAEWSSDSRFTVHVAILSVTIAIGDRS